MFKELIKWSHSEYSYLPWRKNRSLWGTLVSEIMLQQTTVGTVINHFDRFMEQFPDPENLASVSEEEVLAAWKGLGYYRRARNLRNAAATIVENFDGEIPTKHSDLISIKGIGEYTASALISIGKNTSDLAVDANLERVLARFYGVEVEKGPKLQKKIREMFSNKEILTDIKKIGPRNINEALMDLGRTFCQSRKTECFLCPLSKNCIAFQQKKQLSLPYVPEEKLKKNKLLELKLLRIIVKKNGRILGYVKNQKEWLSGQIEIPTFIITSEDKSLLQYPQLEKSIDTEPLESFKTAITKYKIQNYILTCSYEEFQSLTSPEGHYKFYRIDGQSSPFSTTSLKVFKRLKLE